MSRIVAFFMGRDIPDVRARNPVSSWHETVLTDRFSSAFGIAEVSQQRSKLGAKLSWMLKVRMATCLIFRPMADLPFPPLNHRSAKEM